VHDESLPYITDSRRYAMSPLQYQKHLRRHEAERVDASPMASNAPPRGYRVGL